MIRKIICMATIIAMAVNPGCGYGKPASGQAAATAVTETAADVTDVTGAEAAELSVYFFQAGKADAILLSTAEHTILIDCGLKGYGKTVVNYLKQRRIDTVDCLIISHFDKDHVGGAAKVINKLSVDRILQNDFMKDSKECGNYLKAVDKAEIVPETVTEDISFTYDGVSFEVSPARAEYPEKTSNNRSLVVSVTTGETDLLFAGDIETDRIADFVSDNKRIYEFLKVPHHGKEEPAMKELLTSVQPGYAVITSSDDDPESEQVMSDIYDAGAEVFLTRVDPVMLTTDGSDLKVYYVNP